MKEPFDPSTEFILSKVEGLRTGMAQDRPFAWCDCWPWVLVPTRKAPGEFSRGFVNSMSFVCYNIVRKSEPPPL